MKVVFTLLISATFLFSRESALHNLLAEYGNSEELYLKTKKESSGHLIVYSRSDLDKMQAYTLNDILKTIRMYSLQTTADGLTTLVKSGNDQTTNSPIHIYINSHELNSATLGSALTQYAKMSLYFIDHIEVYQASNSVTLGNEPTDTIIRLYTKSPSRENATSSQISADTRLSSSLRVIDAKAFDEYSYLLNLDISEYNFKKYNVGNNELSRDDQRAQFYFNFSKKESYSIEVGATNEKYDIFSGLGNSVTNGKRETKNGYIQASKYFNNKLKITLSLSTERLSMHNGDSAGIKLADGSTSNYIETQIGTNIYDAIIEKRFTKGSNDLFLGVHLKHKEYKIDEFKSDNIDKPMAWGPQKLNIYMLYLQNLYNLNNNNLISFSAKVDYYKNDFLKSSTEHIIRLGYISVINDSLTLKLFAVQGYMYPTFRQTTFSSSYNVNPDLDSAKTNTLTAEAIYKMNNTTLTIAVGNAKSEDSIVFNTLQKRYINYEQTSKLKMAYTRLEHRFDIGNKLIIEGFKMYRKSFFSPGYGGLIQLFNKIANIDIYNELIYRTSYTSFEHIDIPASYNYNLGLIYPLSKKLELKLKGENLLDLAHETPINELTIPTMERRGLLTMEYTF